MARLPGTLRATSAREENFLLVLRLVWPRSELRALPQQFTPKHHVQWMLETIVAHGPRCGGKSHLSCSTPPPRPRTQYKSPACERRSPAQPPEKRPPPFLSRSTHANARFRERQDRIQPLPSTLLESRGAPLAARLLPREPGAGPCRRARTLRRPLLRSNLVTMIKYWRTANEVTVRAATPRRQPLRRFFGRGPAGYRPARDELFELEVQTWNHRCLA